MNRSSLVFIFSIIFIACTENPNQNLATTSSSEFAMNIPGNSPVLFAENLISTYMNERDLAISPDGNEIVYTLGNYSGSKRALVSLKKMDDSWGSPEVLPFSGFYQDIEPFFSPDGSKLFFASTRPINGDSSRQDYNIWYVDRSENGYGEPRDVGETINTNENEFYPSVSRNGNLYFTATYEFGIGREDIFISHWQEGSYQAPQPLDSAINTATYEFNAYISPEEDLLIFSSYGRPDDLGGGDLYISQKSPDGIWTRAQNLGEPINSSSLDYCPFVDFPGNSFYFTSNRSGVVDKKSESIESIRLEYKSIQNGLGNIYQVNISALNIHR